MKSIQTNINFDGVFNGLRQDGGSIAGNIRLDLQNALILLRTLLIYQDDIIGNDHGAYAVSTNVTRGKVTWAGFEKLSYITQNKTTGCTRDPIKGTLITSNEATMIGREIILEICNNEIVNTAWRSMFGAGKDVLDIAATPEGAALLYKFIEVVVGAIGNDFSKASWWGQHPTLVNKINANTNLQDAYKTRMLNTLNGGVGGWLTSIDYLANSNPHLALEIDDLDTNGQVFIGDALALLDRLEANAHPEFDEAMLGMASDYQYPIVFVTKGIFTRLKNQLIDIHKAIPDAMLLRMNGTVSTQLGLQDKISPNSLLINNKLVIARSDWDALVKEVGFTHHRALMTIPQNLGVAIDTADVSGYDGMGLAIEKKPGAQYAGAYTLFTNYEQATMILNPKYIVNASVFI